MWHTNLDSTDLLQKAIACVDGLARTQNLKILPVLLPPYDLAKTGVYEHCYTTGRRFRVLCVPRTPNCAVINARTAPFLRVTFRRALVMRVSLIACSRASSECKALSCGAGKREHLLTFPKGVTFSFNICSKLDHSGD